MEKDLVSIIVPCYNVAPYLEDFFKSVNNITYANYEVIFVDDGSTDDTPKLLEKFIANNKRARVIHKKNGGLSSARNAGIKVANGEFMYMPDPDDFFHPQSIALLHSLITNNEADVVTCSFNKVRASTHYHKMRPVKKIKGIQVCGGGDNVYSKLLSTTTSVVWLRLYRSEILMKFKTYPNVYNTDCVSGEDGVFQDIYFSFCKKAVFCKNKLYFWRKRKGSLTHVKYFDQIANYIPIREEFFLKIEKEAYVKSIPYFRASICLNCMEEIRKISLSPDYQNHELCRMIYQKYCENLKYLAKGKMFPLPFRFGTMFTKPIMYLMIRKKLRS